MSTLSLTIKYRPVRIGWCVESGQWDHFRRALRLTHAFAGGTSSPIIPVDAGDNLPEYLVDRFHVDVLFPVAETDRIKAFIERHNYLEWPTVPERLFWEQWEQRPPYAAFVDVYHSARRIYEKVRDSRGQETLATWLCTWEDDDPLTDVLLATVGAYPSPSATMPDYAGLWRNLFHASPTHLSRNGVLPADLHTGLTPWSLCGAYLEHDGIPGDPGIYIGRADNLIDLTNFWNVRAAGTELLFIDPRYRDRLEPLLENYRRWLASLPSKPWRERGDITAWCRQEVVLTEDFSALGPVAVRRGVEASIWNGLNLHATRPYWSEQPVLGSIDESGDRPSVTFPLPERPTYDEGFVQQYLAVSVSGYDHVIRGQNVAFFPPYLPDLNEYYGRELYYDHSRARADYGLVGGAIRLLVETQSSDVTLRALASLDLATRLFRRYGISATLSRPGVVTARLITQMGGLQGCRVFKIEGVRRLIAENGPEQYFDRTQAVKVIGNFDEETRRPRFDRFEGLYIGTRRGKTLKPEDALHRLLEAGVLRVGLELRCSHCELPAWQSLDDVKTKVTCEYCGSEFDVTTQLRDRNWAYRRSGLFGRDDHQHGGIAVAVTLQQLDTALSFKGMLYTTCLNLTSSRADVDTCETDFVVITSGHSHNRPHLPQIVIGECKAAGGQITRADAEHLAKIADALPSNRLSTFIAFAKTGNFTNAEIEACAAAQAKWEPRVILLSKDELEPYDILDQHRDARELAAHGLEGLAQFTTHRYPQLEPVEPAALRARREAPKATPPDQAPEGRQPRRTTTHEDQRVSVDSSQEADSGE